MGGLGVRSATQLAPSAFLASAAGVGNLLSTLLPGYVLLTPDVDTREALLIWRSMEPTVELQGAAAMTQRAWDDGVSEAVARGLLVGQTQ